MEIFEWTEDTPVTANNLNEMQNDLIAGLDPLQTFVNYTTEEQVIGTWIDGNPIYRKVLVIPKSAFGSGTATTGNTITYAHGITNLDLVINCNCFWEDTSYGGRRIRHLPMSYWQSYSWSMQAIVGTDVISFETGGDALNRIRQYGLNVYAIIEYTKISS